MQRLLPIFRSALPAATILLLLVAAAPGGARAQFEGPSESKRLEARLRDHPTLDTLRRAVREGAPEAQLVEWVEATAAWFELSFEETLRLRSEGFGVRLLASMTQLPQETLGALIEEMRYFQEDPRAGRTGLSKRRIFKMTRQGVPEEEILAAIREQGSAADLEIGEALEIRGRGASPELLAAIARGTLQVPEPAEEEVPLLDDILAASEEEVPLLDDLLDMEEEEEEWEEFGFTPPIQDLLVLADTPKAKVHIVPSTTRPADLLRLSDAEGSTPAHIRLAPGSYYVIVEKPPDEFDDTVIPALRTVHDGGGTSRTLIESGMLYYDVQDCCLPKSLSGDFAITRIGEDQQGIILGDEFGGLPPYLWDGNRFLILDVDKARIERIYKVYLVRKAAGEGRILVATFVPPSHDALSLRRYVAEEPKAEPAYAEFTAPEPAALEALGTAYGIPWEEFPRFEDALMTYGKATYAREGKDGTLTLVTVSLDTLERTRVEELHFKPEGPFGMLATPGWASPAGAGRAREEEPLPEPERRYDDSVDLPILSVANGTESAALLRLGDGTLLFVPAGEMAEMTVGPGTFDMEVRFADAPNSPRKGKVHLTYNARYRLQL